MSRLRDVQHEYVATLTNPNTIRKVRYLVGSWERRTCNPPVEQIDERTFADYRRNCLAEGLAPSGIETNVTDVCTILKVVNLFPKPGRRLAIPKPLAIQPHLVELGKLYAVADRAEWPTRWTVEERTQWWRAYLALQYHWPYRVGDLRRLKTEHLHDQTGEHYPRVEFQGSKTGATYSYPITPTVRRHLAMLLRITRTPWGRPANGELFMLAKGSVRFVRHELKRLSKLAGIPEVTPQRIRRASLSSWACCRGDAGRLAHHGMSGLGVRESYVSMIRVLTAAVEDFEVPVEMLDQHERDARKQNLEKLIAIAKRLPAERLKDMAKMARAFTE